MRWLVDAMNVIGSRPDGWWRDRDAAIVRLVERLERFAATGGEQVTVVLEGPPRRPLDVELVEIAHAPRPGTDAADGEIARRVRADREPESIRVVTSDRRLREQVLELGAVVEGASTFRERIESIEFG